MVARSRWNWLVLAVAFGIIPPCLLVLLASRAPCVDSRAWWRSGCRRVGRRRDDALAIISMKWPLSLSLVCCAVAAAPPLRYVGLFGLLAAAGAFALGFMSGDWLDLQFGPYSSIHVPAIVATSAALFYHYARKFGHPDATGPGHALYCAVYLCPDPRSLDPTVLQYFLSSYDDR